MPSLQIIGVEKQLDDRQSSQAEIGTLSGEQSQDAKLNEKPFLHKLIAGKKSERRKSIGNINSQSPMDTYGE